jgi:hypothetical protein
LEAHLLQVMPRSNDSALCRIAAELKQEFGTVMQQPFQPSWVVLLKRRRNPASSSNYLSGAFFVL